MSITEDGEVIIQLPKHSRRLVVSSNGEAITYSSDRRIAKTYNLQNFPQKLYRYYHQASVLVETVKAKTPKVCFYSFLTLIAYILFRSSQVYANVK
jgi:hypothetical protein